MKNNNMKIKKEIFTFDIVTGFFIGVTLMGAMAIAVIYSVNDKDIYLPVKECIVLRTQCKESGLCSTLETYNCEDINY